VVAPAGIITVDGLTVTAPVSLLASVMTMVDESGLVTAIASGLVSPGASVTPAASVISAGAEVCPTNEATARMNATEYRMMNLARLNTLVPGSDPENVNVLSD
jgi:hypothetical protein